MIQLDGVTKTFTLKGNRKTVLDNVSITLDTARRYAVMGENGAGKSTFLRLIAGNEMPTRGRVRRDARVSWPIGFAGGFHPHMTGRENVVFIANLYGADRRAAIDFTADFAELGAYFDAPVRAYSSGMSARLAFGLSMAISFDFYLVDEVTAVGDSRFQARCVAAFAERRRVSGMLMASHASSTLAQYCEAALVLRNGKLAFFDELDDGVRHFEAGMQAA